jgi:alpha-ketoglutarate-dependent taurine dioxygenase
MTVNAPDIGLRQWKFTPEELTLTWDNSMHSVYSAFWLRDNDPVHRDPATGQRLISLIDLPSEPKLHAVEPRRPGHLTLLWEDGAISHFSLAWLRAFDRSLRIGHRPVRMPWLANPSAAFAHCDYQQWKEDAGSREEWLYFAGRDGIAFLTGVPVAEGAVREVAEFISLPCDASSGPVAHLHSRGMLSAGPHNQPSGLPVQTDQPYRDPVPSFQMRHCLSAADQGGESLFLDGFAVAERIRAGDPDHFQLLKETPVLFQFQDAHVDLVAERTMIELDTLGQFRSIHYNDRFLAPLPLKAPKLKKFYPAYRNLADLLRDPQRQVVHRLEPGELVLFDNSRILHGHAAFSGGARRLQTCFLDADGLYSSLAVLSRTRTA